jgi:hypothetical protein
MVQGAPDLETVAYFPYLQSNFALLVLDNMHSHTHCGMALDNVIIRGLRQRVI